ncbi:hypothetical protein M9H77_12064 [Catharanthus roseus]|uniref:Uncharacterized protein n=1 Tax=Catharanthus roseus TaxID=4058 RepID=A0ACC0BGE8_CATRO|nr:hypothetical protein M9H77_12064 [Catharanthus roseus]
MQLLPIPKNRENCIKTAAHDKPNQMREKPHRSLPSTKHEAPVLLHRVHHLLCQHNIICCLLLRYKTTLLIEASACWNFSAASGISATVAGIFLQQLQFAAVSPVASSDSAAAFFLLQLRLAVAALVVLLLLLVLIQQLQFAYWVIDLDELYCMLIEHHQYCTVNFFPLLQSSGGKKGLCFGGVDFMCSNFALVEIQYRMVNIEIAIEAKTHQPDLVSREDNDGICCFWALREAFGVPHGNSTTSSGASLTINRYTSLPSWTHSQ